MLWACTVIQPETCATDPDLEQERNPLTDSSIPQTTSNTLEQEQLPVQWSNVLQIAGTAMDNRVALSYAFHTMVAFETSHVHSYHLQLLVYLHYIDDIFIILQHGMESLIEFIGHLSSSSDSLIHISNFNRGNHVTGNCGETTKWTTGYGFLFQTDWFTQLSYEQFTWATKMQRQLPLPPVSLYMKAITKTRNGTERNGTDKTFDVMCFSYIVTAFVGFPSVLFWFFQESSWPVIAL